MSFPWFTFATRLNTLVEVVPGGGEKDYRIALIRRIRFGGCNEFNLNRRIRRGVIHSTKTVGGAVPPKKSTMALRTTAASDIGWKNALSWMTSDLSKPKWPRADINLVGVIRAASGRRFVSAIPDT